MGAHDQHLDTILLTIGPRGKFVFLQLVLLWIAVVPLGFQLLSNVFIGRSVPNRCARPKNETAFISTYTNIGEGRGIHDVGVVGGGDHPNLTVSYTQCHIHLLSNGSVVKQEGCLYGMDYYLPVDSSFVSEFDLVCDSTNLGRLTQTLVIGGQAVGALFGPLFSDRLGRKPVLIVAHLGLMISGVVISYSTNAVMFSVAKFIVGCFQQATLTVAYTLLLELMMTQDRRIAAALGGLFWASGVILLDLVAFLFKDYSWRTLQFAISLGTIPVFLEVFLLKESLRWLLANGKTKEASVYVKTVGKMNGKSPEQISRAIDLIVPEDPSCKSRMTANSKNPAEVDGITNKNGRLESSSSKISYLSIFKHPRLFRNTVILWLGWFTCAFAFFVVYLGSTSLSGNRFVNFFLIALMEVPTKIYFYFGLNRHGRKKIVVSTLLMTAIGLIASGVCRSLESTSVTAAMSVTFNMVAMAGASGGFLGLFFYTPELYPTNIRNQAMGVSSTISRFGGMLAPFSAILGDQAEWAPGLLIGGLAIIVAVLFQFLPETNGRELPQTLDDLLAWFPSDHAQTQPHPHSNSSKKGNGTGDRRNLMGEKESKVTGGGGKGDSGGGVSKIKNAVV